MRLVLSIPMGTATIMQRAALLCRRDRPPLVWLVGKLLCSNAVLTLSSNWHLCHPRLCYPPYTTVEADAARFYTVGCAIVYCVTPYKGRCCPFFIRLAAQSSTVLLPYATIQADAVRFLNSWRRDFLLCYPPTLLLGQMLSASDTIGCAILYCATPPILLLGQMPSVLIRLAARSSTVLPHLLGVLSDPLLCYPSQNYT